MEGLEKDIVDYSCLKLSFEEEWAVAKEDESGFVYW